MSQYKLLIVAVLGAASSPLISSQTGIALPVLFMGILCSLIWAQEIFIIQIKFSDENIEFTKRFKENYTGLQAIILGLLPHFLSIFIVVYIFLEIGGQLSTSGWLILSFTLLTLVRIFDPLLGCISTPGKIPWSNIVGYIVIFAFATSSAIDPSKLEFYPLPLPLVEALLLSIITFTILNLRMAYYQKYCFLEEQSLEQQLKLVLIPLLVLSVHQMLTIVNSIDFTSILNR